jgi:hypothetical protein
MAVNAKVAARNSPEFDHSILRHSGIYGAADETVLNKVLKKIRKNPPVNITGAAFDIF